MKLQLQLLTATIALTHVHALPSPATKTLDTLPSSTDASAYLSDVYSAYNGVPPQVTGAIATSLASSLYNLELSWETHAMKASDDVAILSAAAQGTDGPAVVESIDSSGYDYGHITAADWYTQHVPDDVKSDVAGYNSAWESVIVRIVPAATTSVSTAGAPAGGAAQAKCTGVAMALAAGAMGVLAAM